MPSKPDYFSTGSPKPKHNPWAGTEGMPPSDAAYTAVCSYGDWHTKIEDTKYTTFEYVAYCDGAMMAAKRKVPSDAKMSTNPYTPRTSLHRAFYAGFIQGKKIKRHEESH